MIDLNYFKKLNKEEKKEFIKNYIQDLIQYTNEILDFVFVNNGELSRYLHRDLVERLYQYMNEMMNLFHLYQEIK
jgi:ureidoglycolate hydrolase